jgi:hypothetical protein
LTGPTVWTTENDGTSVETPRMSTIPACAIVAEVIADTDAGTFCSDWARFCTVTTTSATVGVALAVAGAGESAAAADAAGAKSKALAQASHDVLLFTRSPPFRTFLVQARILWIGADIRSGREALFI